MTPSWPIVGRADELAVVMEATGGERGSGIVIAGAPGVGKTRLAREAAAALEQRYAVEWLAATPASASVPFGAVAYLLTDADVDAADDRLRLMRHATTALAERAAGRPLVLAVDDAQWLDASSAALVHQLVVSRGGRVLLTVRTGVSAPGPIVTLWKDTLVELLELQPLTLHDVEELMHVALGDIVEHATVRRLFELSQGNALFLRELVLAGLEGDKLRCDEGVWRWSATLEHSTRLSAIVDDRMGRLDHESRELLDHLALGEPLSVEDVNRFCETANLEDLERTGLIVIDTDDSVRLSHPLYAEVLRAAMTTSERRRLARSLADALEPAAATSRVTLLRVASWRLENARPTDPALLTDAAEVANALFDHELAERLARRALTEGAGLRAALALGEGLSRSSRGKQAAEELENYAPLAATDDERAAVAIARSFALAIAYGYRRENASVLFDAQRTVREPSTLALLQAQQAITLSFSGDIANALTLAQPLLSDDTDVVTRLRAFIAVGPALLSGGRPDSAAATAIAHLDAALEHQHEFPQGPFTVMATYLPALIVSGRLDEADAAVAAIDAAAPTAAASADAVSYLAFVRGASALFRGHVRTAQRLLRESIPGMRAAAGWRLSFPLALLAEACALAGDAPGAESASAEADELVQQVPILEGIVRRARAWTAFARGQRSHAAELAVAAAEWAGAHEQYTAEVLAFHDALRFTGDGGAAHRLAERGTTAEGDLAAAMTAHARSFVAGDAVELEEVATRFEDLGALLLAAEAAAQASQTFHRSGLVARGDRADARARVLRDACENAHSPVLDDFEEPSPLTAREREVAWLAAQGMSSSSIAERLFISTRTVEGHLHRAYVKLGVNDRRQLARLLGIAQTDSYG